MFRKKLIVFKLLMVAVLFVFSSVSFADELSEIQAAIKAKGKKWVAGKTSMMMLTPEERRMRLGHLKSILEDEGIPYEETFTAVPSTFDWRNIDGNGTSYVTPIRNQSSCGSCWAFADTAGLESYTLMTQNMPNYNLDLAEQILISCYNTNGCSGGSPSGASYYIMTVGLPLETCFPYKAFDANDGADSVFCSEACANWQQNTYKILDYGSVSKNVSTIKDALVSYGPLVTTFSVYSDFFGYNGGIYSYTTGTYQGGHAVLIVGYDDINECFIVKNSWGTGWGESGYFRIDYDELNTVVNFGSYTLTYYGSLEQVCSTDAECDDGIFCNGTEYCDAISGCLSTGDPCQAGTSCNEATDTCDQVIVCGNGNVEGDEDCDDGNTADGDCCSSNCMYEASGSSCSDGQYCNGDETCDGAGVCQAGTQVICPDNDLFCDGTEVCDDTTDSCQSRGNPCLGMTCLEDTDTCKGCGDGYCAGLSEDENCNSCPADCSGKSTGKPSKRWCCGDGDCQTDLGETVDICPIDCDPPSPSDCGNGTCNPGEDKCNCPQDCGIPVEICNDGTDNDCDGMTDCDDSDCTGKQECNVECKQFKETCTSDLECCVGLTCYTHPKKGRYCK